METVMYIVAPYICQRVSYEMILEISNLAMVAVII